MKSDIRFDSDFTKQLYTEVSALQDMKKIDRPFISRKYIWAVWQKVYKAHFGCTRHFLLPDEDGSDGAGDD
ncbi:MAG: hypothetical protein J5829_08460 [Lachnospiraceae bacterium]|nr:hypothetical protein [Lachnospiraceae bacterium]